MVLKRQTVWLLTMLSLIIVLSVYYISTPPTQGDQLAYLGEENTDENTEANTTDNSEESNSEAVIEFEEVTEASGTEMLDEDILFGFSDDVFSSVRLDRQVARDRQSADYVAVIASADVSPEVQSKAFDNNEKLHALAQKEELLETLIKAKGYSDVLVIAEDNEVKIIVKADELSRDDALEINLMAKEQLGDKTVAVGFQPTN